MPANSRRDLIRRLKVKHYSIYFLTGLHFPSHFLDRGARAGPDIKLITDLTNKVRFPAGAEMFPLSALLH